MRRKKGFGFIGIHKTTQRPIRMAAAGIQGVYSQLFANTYLIKYLFQQ